MAGVDDLYLILAVADPHTGEELIAGMELCVDHAKLTGCCILDLEVVPEWVEGEVKDISLIEAHLGSFHVLRLIRIVADEPCGCQQVATVFSCGGGRCRLTRFAAEHTTALLSGREFLLRSREARRRRLSVNHRRVLPKILILIALRETLETQPYCERRGIRHSFTVNNLERPSVFAERFDLNRRREQSESRFVALRRAFNRSL